MHHKPGLIKTIGNWVEGDRLWDREQEMALFIESLDQGAHLLLMAQRRIGKTSLMREAARRLQHRYLCLQVDWQEAASAADAIAELSVATRPHQSLWHKTKALFANIAQTATDSIDTLQVADLKISLRSGLTKGDWRTKGDQLFAVLAESEQPVVVFLDEVPILVSRLLKGDNLRITPERRAEADRFMSWLRASSLQYQGKVRLIVTGSIGLEPVLRQAGLSATINHFSPFELGPWSAAAAQGCLEALAIQYSLTFEEGAITRMLECIGIYIPYHVQLFFEQIYQSCRLEGIDAATPELVDKIYQTRLLSVRGRAELSHLEERLKLVMAEELYLMALDLLTEAAVVGILSQEAAQIIAQEHASLDGALRPKDAMREILSVLEHDGYLQPSEIGYGFVSKLVKDWWQARYGFNFIPAARRRGD